MESGLYVTFFSKDEPRDRELPPVGPLDRVVLRHRRLVADRGTAQQAQDPGISIDRWLEAELELQRATGEEPGGTKRPEMRFSAPDGVYLRFAVFGDEHERDPIPELGPFAAVTVGPRILEADGQTLATRTASDLAPWELTSRAGSDFAGLHKPDLAFRNTSGAYHTAVAPAPGARVPQVEPAITPPPARSEPTYAPPPRSEPVVTPPPPQRTEPLFTPPPPARSEPVFTPPPPREPLFTPPPASEPLFKPREASHPYLPAAPLPPPAGEAPALTARDLELIQRIDRERAEETLRARVQEEERRRLGVDEATDDDATTWAMRYRPQAANVEVVGATGEAGFSFGALLWRMRFAIIGILLIGAGAYGFIAFRTGSAPNVSGVQQFSYVTIGSKFSGTRWDWVVNGVQHVAEAGSAKAQGVYYIVRVGASNRGSEGAQLAPNDFTLVDATGAEHSALGFASGVYQGPTNTGSQNVWPRDFPVGKTVNFNVVFDVDPALGKGMVLALADSPKTRVRLD